MLDNIIIEVIFFNIYNRIKPVAQRNALRFKTSIYLLLRYIFQKIKNKRVNPN